MNRVFSEGSDSRSDLAFGPVWLAGEKKVSLVRRKKRLCHIQLMSKCEFLLSVAILPWLIKVFDSGVLSSELGSPHFASLEARAVGHLHIMSGVLKFIEGKAYEELGPQDWRAATYQEI